MIKREVAIKQLREIEKLAKNLRLAADSWPAKWQTLVATLMSARTTDAKTIPVAQELFNRFNNLDKLARARVSQIAKIIRPVNFYKTKARNISKLAKILVRDYKGNVPMNFEKLVELPGVGRKTANVFLAEYGHSQIGVDTHVSYISRKLGWTKHEKQEGIEEDLKKLFPQRSWGKLNWILVRFGQTYKSRREKNEILERVRKIK